MSENIYTEIDGRKDILKVAMSYGSLTGAASMWVVTDIYPSIIETSEDETSTIEFSHFPVDFGESQLFFSAIQVTLDDAGFYDGSYICKLPTEARLMFTKFIASARAFHDIYDTGIHDEFGGVINNLRLSTIVERHKFAVVNTTRGKK